MIVFEKPIAQVVWSKGHQRLIVAGQEVAVEGTVTFWFGDMEKMKRVAATINEDITKAVQRLLHGVKTNA